MVIRNIKDQRIVSNIPDVKGQALTDTIARNAVQRPQTRAGLGPVKIDGTEAK